MTASALNVYVTNDPFYYENGYTLSLRDGGPCWIIDPGLPPQAQRIAAHVQRHRLTPAAVILTHGHADHIAGLDEVLDRVGPTPVYMAQPAWPALSNPMENLSGFMGEGFTCRFREPIDLPHGATLDLDGISWRVLDVSGHAPGSRALYSAEVGVVIVGDALFAGSVGRVDFPHSDGALLIRNIRTHLLALPDETRVLSGHGEETTIGRERQNNPFLLDGLP